MPMLRTTNTLLRPGGSQVKRLVRPDGTFLDLGASSVPDDGGAPAPGGFSTRSEHPYWTTLLDPRARVAPTSDVLVNALASQFDAEPGSTPLDAPYGGAYKTDVSVTDFSIPVYRVPLDTPRVPVVAIRGGYRSKRYTLGGVTYYMQDSLEGVPLPSLDQLKDGRIEPSGDDGSVIIICGREMWELWRFRPLEAHREGHYDAKYRWQCEQGGYAEDTRYHPLWWSSSLNGVTPRGGDYGVSAAGMSYFPAMLTAEDWEADEIGHPLTVALPLTGGATGRPNVLFPATRFDKYNLFRTADSIADPYRIPEGAQFFLPGADWSNSAIDAYAASRGVSRPGRAGSSPAVLAKVMRCVRNHGFVVADTAGVIGFSAEANKTFGTIYNPASTIPAWGNFPQQLPWRSLKQLEVPTVQFHTPGSGPTTPQPAAYDFSFAP